MSLKSAYNFVPLSPKVVAVDGAGRISQDVPFSDGISGWIDLELEVHTPLCVGCGQQKDDQRGILVSAFRTPDGKLAIPGSSIRGMLRGVMEIAAFGKMQFVNDRRRYAVRDLQNQNLYVGRMAGPAGAHNGRPVYASKTRAGFLKKSVTGSHQLIPCAVARIEHEDLITYLRENGRQAAAKAFQQVIGRRSSLGEKYEAWGKERKIAFNLDAENEHSMSGGRGYLRFQKALPSRKGSNSGQVVFSGQIGPRTRGRGKHREFVFFGPDESKAISVPEQVFDDFDANHSEDQGEKHGGQRMPNAEWAYWEREFERGEWVPVFYLPDETSRKGVSSMGLAQMYRLAYKHSIGDLIRHTSPKHLDAQLVDIPEAIFGRMGAEDALARRVMSGLFTTDQRLRTEVHGPTVLGAPKPTFYPAYVRQKIESSGRVPMDDRGKPIYHTYMDDQAEISGWKRYPTRSVIDVPKPPEKSRPTVWVRLEAVEPPARFQGRLRVHNLRPAELGALIWALDFGGKPHLRHALGLGKPMGFGSVSLRVIGNGLRVLSTGAEMVLEEARSIFEEHMGQKLGEPLEETEQVIQLRAMADPDEASCHDLSHSVLGRGRDGNEFKNAVQAGLALAPYVDARARGLELRQGRLRTEQEAEELAVAAKRQAELEALSPLERSMREVVGSSSDPEEVALFKAWEKGRWEGQGKQAVAEHIRAIMQQGGAWKAKKKSKRGERVAALKAFLGEMGE